MTTPTTDAELDARSEVTAAPERGDSSWQRLNRVLGGREAWVAAGTVLIVKVFLLWYGVVAYEAMTNQAVNLPHGLLDIWNRWDSPHYLDLAEQGYQNSGEIRLFLVFFPLFPWLARLAAIPFDDVLIGAFVVSTVASVAIAVLFYHLARLDDPPALAQRAVWFLFIFPTSFFLHIAYTESLFIALTLGSFLLARKRLWMEAGIIGAFAALARVSGLLLIPALAVEAFYQYRAERRLRWEWIWIGVPVAGFGAYLWLNQSVTGDPLTFMEIQKGHWGRTLALPWDGLRETVKAIDWRGPAETQIVAIQELVFVAIGLAGTIATWLLLRPSYAVWMTGNWLLFASNSFVASVPRYTLVMFPLFIIFARLAENRTVSSVITVWSLLFLGLFAALFVQGRWAF